MTAALLFLGWTTAGVFAALTRQARLRAQAAEAEAARAQAAAARSDTAAREALASWAAARRTVAELCRDHQTVALVNLDPEDVANIRREVERHAAARESLAVAQGGRALIVHWPFSYEIGTDCVSLTGRVEVVRAGASWGEA